MTPRFKNEKATELPTGAYTVPSSLCISAGQTDKLTAFDTVEGDFRILKLNRSARLMFQTLAETHSPQLTLEVLQSEYPNVPIERLRNDLTFSIDTFVSGGWLQPSDQSEIHIQQLSTLKLPNDMTERIASYMQTLENGTLTDAHHFASAVLGKPASMVEANNRAANMVREGIEIAPSDLAVGAYGVIGVLESAHGLTHGLHSVIGLGEGHCLSIIGRQGNIGIAPIDNFVQYYKDWLVSIGFPGDVEKIRLYTQMCQ